MAEKRKSCEPGLWHKGRDGLSENNSVSLAAIAPSTLPRHLYERLESAEEHAQEMVRLIELRRATHLRAWQTTFSAIASGKLKRREGLLRLWKHADELVRIVGNRAGCRKGCSHCCYIPVALSVFEAQVIGQFIGRAPVVSAFPCEPAPAGYDNPCPFLVEGTCSIYAFRPLACRLHFNLDKDDLLCRHIPEGVVPVPLLDANDFYATYALLLKSDEPGDIRQLFPSYAPGGICEGE